ncbi:hypothetical protein Tco_0532916 [Tanacetum coccineum]
MPSETLKISSAISNPTLLKCFKSLKPWDNTFRLKNRLTWLSIEGFPPQAWHEAAFTWIARLWGDVVLPEKIRELTGESDEIFSSQNTSESSNSTSTDNGNTFNGYISENNNEDDEEDNDLFDDGDECDDFLMRDGGTKSSNLQEHPATENLNILASGGGQTVKNGPLVEEGKSPKHSCDHVSESQFENTTKSAHTDSGMTLERTRTNTVDFAADKVTCVADRYVSSVPFVSYTNMGPTSTRNTKRYHTIVYKRKHKANNIIGYDMVGKETEVSAIVGDNIVDQ